MKVNIKYKDKGENWCYPKVRIDREDTWNMDTTLAYIIVPMLKQLRDTTHGYPPDFYDEKHENDEGYDEWRKILDKMIWSFEQAQKEYDHDFNLERLDRYKDYLNKVQEGFDLFGKYYMNLWD